MADAPACRAFDRHGQGSARGCLREVADIRSRQRIILPPFTHRRNGVHEQQGTPIMGLIAEAQRRKVFKVAAGYLVIGWLVIQVAATVLPQFDLPGWAPRLVTLLVMLGLPIAIVMAWMFDVTPDGVRLDASSVGSKRVLSVAAVLAAVTLGWYFHGRSDQRAGAPFAGPASAPASRGIASIAVLPFLDMSQAHDQEYFSDGLSEELLNLLAQLPQMRVIARTSSFSFKGKDVDVATIAKALNVANVLEGSVRKSGNTLRITAQLIRASDSSHLWSHTYDRELTDVFKVQDEIAAAVVAALKVQLLPKQALSERPRSANLEAYDQYLIGRQFTVRGNEDNWRRAIAAYEKAVALDPGFALAYAELASTRGFLADAVGDTEGMQLSLRTVETAIRLAPTLPDGYVVRSIDRISFNHDWRGAEADVDKALALGAGDSTVQVARARLMIGTGRLPEAIVAARKGVQLDPLSSRAWTDLGRYLNAAHQLTEASQAIGRALEISPESNYALFHRGETDLLDGKPRDALEPFNKAGSGYGLAGVAMAQHSLGDDTASRQALDAEIAQFAQGGAYQIAEAYAWRGERDQAFAWLDRAYAQRDGGLSFIKCDPLVANLSADPRFPALLGKLGLPKQLCAAAASATPATAAD
jgi:TolB-like protein